MTDRIPAMETHIARLDAIIPTLATREDLARFESVVPTLATREDLANLKAVLHSDMNKLTWLIVTLLAGLLPAMLAATVYVVKWIS